MPYICPYKHINSYGKSLLCKKRYRRFNRSLVIISYYFTGPCNALVTGIYGVTRIATKGSLLAGNACKIHHLMRNWVLFCKNLWQ